jgi:multidrug efflux pump subunit AcrA (membrane-fusion protein)
MFFGEVESRNVALTLVADPHVTASGHAREVAPAVDQKTSTVRVKVAIENPPSAMTLGSAVAGTAKRQPAVQIMLPWTALMATESKPAVWIVDPATKTVSLKPVTIARYETEEVAIRDGLEGGERVVVDGGKLLSTGESVTYEEDPL